MNLYAYYVAILNSRLCTSVPVQEKLVELSVSN